MIEAVKKEVYKFMGKDESGHSNDHIDRVLDLTLKFAKEENADENVAALIALLHDVDDYKLVSEEEAKNLTNARRILETVGASEKVKEQVLSELTRIGYSKSLAGIRPITIEGKIVSDADMCDASGVNGFIRCYKYNVKHGGVLFDKNEFPMINMSAEEYKKSDAYSAVNHMFEKILKLKGLMLTNSGKKEAGNRHEIIIQILYQLFDEENADDWKKYLDEYLTNLNNN
jgi:uncharacterized protein